MARLPAPALSALIPLFLLSGCATVFGSRRPALVVAADVDSATVLGERGRVLGVTPLAGPLRLPARGSTTLIFAHPSRDTVRVRVGRRTDPVTSVSTLFGAGIAAFGAASGEGRATRAGLALAVLGWLADHVSGSAWLHSPDSVYAVLPPRAPPPLAADPPPQTPPPAGGTFSDPVLIAETLRQLATAAYEVGCDSTFPRFWLNERDHLVGGDGPRRALSPAETDAIGRNVAAAVARLREACARANPLAREDRRAIENPLPPIAEDLSAPVLFDNASAAVPDSVLPRLRELARRLRPGMGGLTLVVEGFAAPGGSDAYNQALGLARARAVLAVLRAAGLPDGCCIARSYGADPASLAAPDAVPASPQARYNRRVTFHLAPPEGEK